jgi:methionine--tRNA ligase beta chain|tara:strand:- start:1436 stop:1786 length:351 start_codon:yes stop_codon:yes gene_type:complete
MSKEQIEFSEFLEIEKKLEICIGEITSAEEVEGADRLLKLEVDFGGETKVSVTNIKSKLIEQFGSFESIVGKSSPFVMNLKPSKMRGVMSEVMIMPLTNSEGEFIFKNINKGTKLL